MAKWTKEVEVEDIDDAKKYFIARGTQVCGYMFISKGLNGKRMWSVKPGIALRFNAEETRRILTENIEWVGVEVPNNADSRWRARKPVFKRKIY